MAEPSAAHGQRRAAAGQAAAVQLLKGIRYQAGVKGRHGRLAAGGRAVGGWAPGDGNGDGDEGAAWVTSACMPPIEWPEVSIASEIPHLVAGQQRDAGRHHKVHAARQRQRRSEVGALLVDEHGAAAIPTGVFGGLQR